MNPAPQNYAPEPGYRDCLSCLHWIESESAGATALPIKAGPKFALMVIYSGTLTQQVGEEHIPIDPVTIVGPVTSPYTLHFAPGKTALAIAEFTEPWFYQLFPCKTRPLLNRFYPMDDLIGSVPALIADRQIRLELIDHSVEQRLTAIQRFIGSRIPVHRRADSELIERVVNLVKVRGPGILVGEICRLVDVNPRTMERRMQTYMGYTLSNYIKIVRFTMLFDIMMGSDKSNLATAIEALGYYDQSHVIRDFHKYAGFSQIKILQERFQFASDLSRPFIRSLQSNGR